jgi:hypothetical protein
MTAIPAYLRAPPQARGPIGWGIAAAPDSKWRMAVRISLFTCVNVWSMDVYIPDCSRGEIADAIKRCRNILKEQAKSKEALFQSVTGSPMSGYTRQQYDKDSEKLINTGWGRVA